MAMAWLAALHSLNYLKTFAEGDEEKAESELKMNMEDVEARLSHAIEQGGLKDREIKSVRRQLDSRDDELAEMTRGREVALKENRRLQTDLNAMTEEHQAIHQQLQEALEEQESLKVQISEYARQVARVEELLAQKEQEKEELLEQYQVLSSEAERLVTESKVSAGKVTNYHMELVQKQRSEMELSDKIRRLEGEIQQVRVSLMNKRQQMRRDVMHPQITSARFVK